MSYTITTRSTGTVLTAAIYNADHQNHADNNIPASIDSYQTDLTEMRSQSDPGEIASEALATDLSVELRQLRWAINDIKGSTTYWYETPTALIVDVNENVGIGATPEITWNPNDSVLQVGGISALHAVTVQAPGGALTLAHNARYTGVSSEYIITDEAADYRQIDGTHVFRVAASGTADTAISWTNALTIDNSGDSTFIGDGAFQGNEVSVGTVGGAAFGQFIAYGQATGSDDGGEIHLHTADDHDTTLTHWRMRAFQDDFLLIAAGVGTALTVDSSLNTTFGGNINLGDSKKILLGTGSDLQISHEVTNSFINNLTGDLYLQDNVDSGKVIVQTKDAGSTLRNVLEIGGATPGVAIKHGGSTVASSTTEGLSVVSGFKFPATQVPSSDANTLDDYEEGNWTPVLSDGTNDATMSGNTAGVYEKIGRQVTVRAAVQTTSLGSVSGGVRVTGLPYTSAASPVGATGTVGFAAGLAITAGYSVSGYIPASSSYIQLNVYNATTGTTSMQDTEWTADGYIIISVTYHV